MVNKAVKDFVDKVNSEILKNILIKCIYYKK